MVVVGQIKLEVYPRVCGGTNEIGDALAYVYGLSPRVRGNHRASLPAGGSCGSIPACAGEPKTG